MEALIWKYVDNVCTDDERQELEHLIKNDPEIKELFDEIVGLNALVSKEMPKKMDEKFKSKMIFQIQQELVKADSKPVKILSTPWIVTFVLPSIAAIVYAVMSPGQASLLPDVHIPISDKAIEMALWSMTGFLLLLLADYTLKKLDFFKKISHFHLV